MVLVMINNRAKQAMHQKTSEESEDSHGVPQTKEHAKAKELNNLIRQMSVKLPRSECDEYESREESGDSTTKTINNK